MTLKTNQKDPDNRGREAQEFELRTIWLGIECLVKIFNRGEDEKIGADEVNKLCAEDSESGSPNSYKLY